MKAQWYHFTILSFWIFSSSSNEGKILHVKEVDACPTNQSSWEKASRDLNCTTEDRYQCTSNENQTALLEYCYDEPPTFVLKGHCWILLESHYVDTYNCSGFIDGCPNETYRSNELYKYQDCLQLNELEGCYAADEECLRQNKVTPLPSTTSQSSDPKSSSDDAVIGIVTSIIIVFIIIVVATLVVRKLKVSKGSERDHGNEEIGLLETTPTLKIEKAGENIVMRCILPKDKRRLPSNIIWYKDKKEIKIEDTGGKYRFEDQKHDLVIESAGSLDIGEYVCCLKYDNHCEKFVKCNLDCPIISLGGISSEGPDVVIEYTVSVSKDCIPLTTLSWRKNGCSLKPSDEPDTYVGGTLEDTFLKICNVVGGNSDKYECSVRNIFGESTISFILDDIQCSSKECQGILLCCLLLDEFRLLKFEPDQWKERLKQSKEFCSVRQKMTTTENALDAIEFETLHDFMVFRYEEYCLISPDQIFQSFLQRSGFLDFFLKYSTSHNLGIFCRSPGYRKSEGEICCNLSPEQFSNLVQQIKFDILSNNSITDETCHQIIEDELNIPKGILSLGREGIQNYLHDLRSGEHKVFVARGMLVGCEGAGKTSLLQRLQGKDNPDPQSTRGLDVHVNMFTVNEERLDVTANKIKPSLLSKLNNQGDPNTNEAEQGLGDQSSTKTISGGSVVENRVENFVSVVETPLNIQEYNEQVSEVTENSKTRQNEVFNENAIPDGPVLGNNESNATEPSKVNDQDVETIDFGPLSTDDANVSPDTDITCQILSESFTDKDRKIITFFDFAGQFAYYACHHIYFSPNDFYILVMDITKKFDHMVYKDKAQETPNKDDKTEEEMSKMERSVYSCWTYLEFTEYWLQSILSHTVGLTPKEKMEDFMGIRKDTAPLILVATHAEGISRKEGEAYFRDLRDKLPKLSAHVNYGKAFSTGFDDDLQEIKNCILEVVQTLPNWGKNIPMSWFYIECQIRKLKELKIITLEGLLENCMTHNIGIQSQNDLKTPLRFLSNIGVVLYFDEEFLKQVIILDVQWFVDAFKHVITDAEHAKLDVDQQLYEEWKSFNETGLLTSYLLHSIWRRCPESALYISNRKDILSYMVRLNLLTVVSKDTWYCPCMNKQIFPTKDFEHLENSSLLCFQFSYLPKDMFHRVIAACCNQLKWKIVKMEYLCIYQMATLFDVNRSKVLVGMYSNNKIVVQFLDISQSKMVDNFGVRGNITKVIDMSAERLKNCTYEVGYMCRKNVFGRENVPISHFLAESKMIGESINCPKCGFQRKVIVEEIIWKESLKNMRQDSGSRELIHSSALTVEEIASVNVIGIDNIPHIGSVFSGNIWLSDKENILKINMSGITQRKIPYHGRWSGGHTLTCTGDLLYIDGGEIRKLSPNDENIVFTTLKYAGWCIHSSRINGDVLVGVQKIARGFEDGMIIRFNKSGEKLAEIEKHANGGMLFLCPRYICENISGEICVTDDIKNIVIVVSKNGETKFIYSGQKSEHYFRPRGLCTNSYGNLLVCNASSWNSNVQILDQDGHLLCLFQLGLKDPMSICMDENNKIYIGQIRSSTIKVFKLLY